MAARDAKGLGASGPPVASGSPWDDDEATTVAPMIDFAERSGVIPDIDADTVLDDRSIDEVIVGFAIGTGADSRGSQRTPSPRRASGPALQSAPRPASAAPPFASTPASAAPQPVVAYPSSPAMVHPVYPVYAPTPGQYGGPHAYLPPPAQPVPPFAAAQMAARWRGNWIVPLLLICVLAGGAVVLGKFVFAGGHGAVATAPAAPATAAAPVTASAPPVTSPQPPAAATTPAASAPAAANPAPTTVTPPAGPIQLEVASLSKAAESLATAPKGGVVVRAFLTGEHEVKQDEKLFEISHKSHGGERARELAEEIRKLEALASDEPEYQPFLDKARREYGQIKEQTETVVVRAPRAGVATPQVSSGAHVRAGDLLATTGDTRSWIARAPLAGGARPGFDWSCALTVVNDASGARATCAIEQLVDSEEGSEAIVRVKDEGAAWLQADGQKKYRLVLEPPAAGAAH